MENACLSIFKKHIYKIYENWKGNLNNTVVRIKWDPEKSIKLGNLDYKPIQIGLKGGAVKKYLKRLDCSNWWYYRFF